MANNSTAAAAAKGKAAASSSDDSDDSDSDTANKSIVPLKSAQQLKPSITSTPNFKPVAFVSGGFAKDEKQNGDHKAPTNGVGGKKRKTSETSNSSFTIKNGNKNASLNKSTQSAPNTPFRRVKTEDVSVDPRLADNSYDAKVN